eukprot:CAMPEP_0119042338 /NCGR_PEP_ID=MMETSP1177-20130426/14612_1 /TAXON_ID=2985 /ORGANISM="Ochromonas sp, Strain CCMP1899" /LENGTH=467 /DNA_ID=CAMNT_0007009051 /DNA_START=257 /DNA_END=1657 /DNA_ORIENTATION=-
MSADDEVEAEEEYKTQANLLKDQGNELFQTGKIQEAILSYTQAIDLDPDNHVFYSNRSAAYMKGDSKSKALYDAEKCVKIAPTWSKGYIRLGAAQQSLKRFEAAIDTFKKAIEFDAGNQTLWTSLRSCQEAFEADKKTRFAVAATDREKEADRLIRLDKLKAEAVVIKIEKEKEKAAENAELELTGFLDDIAGSSSSGKGAEGGLDQAESKEDADDDLLSGFFNDMTEKETAKTVEKNVKDETYMHEKYTTQDLGDRKVQYERIMSTNYEWKNLNPFYVLQLGTDATEEDIKQRYRKMAVFLHPDKMRDVENARECFEQVKNAYQLLCDEKAKNVVVINIEHITKEVTKERKRLLAKDVKDLLPLDEQITKKLMKHFAEIEMLKRRSEKNIHAYNAREKMQEGEEQAQVVKDAKFEKEWSDIDRRENRVGNWRDFGETSDAKRSKVANFKEETRTEDKHGKVKLQEW